MNFSSSVHNHYPNNDVISIENFCLKYSEEVQYFSITLEDKLCDLHKNFKQNSRND